jgi:hypothetical protein
MAEIDLQTPTAAIFFHFPDAKRPERKHRCRQQDLSAARYHSLVKMLERPSATGSDDRYGHCVGNGLCELEGIACQSAIAIQTGRENDARAQTTASPTTAIPQGSLFVRDDLGDL